MLIGWLGLAILIVLLLARVPVALATGAVAALGVLAAEFALGAGPWESGQAMLAMLQQVLHVDAVAMVVLFLLLGNLAFYAGISTRIYDAAAVWLQRVPGGMAIAAIMGCGGFAAISGSSVACASTMGRICVPEMLKQGYDARLATSAVAVGGTLGSLIPPSVLFIIFGLLSDTSVAHLFIAGILPGLLSLAGMVGVVIWWVAEDRGVAPAASDTRASRREASMALWPPVILLAIIVGGITSGWATPGMAAALCVLVTLVIGILQGRLNVENLWQVLRQSAVQSLSVLALIAAARIFMGFLDLTGVGQVLADAARSAGLPMLTVLAIAAIVYLLMGMVIEPLGILVLTVPIMLPLTQVYGLDLIWFGVLVVKLLEIALITPPVGLNVFVIGSVTRNIGMDRIFAGVARFLMVDLLVLLVLILFPAVSLWLPGLMAR
ncbi:TRAP transporter large permease [Paracoccus homiensis]|uniref:TRAP transporter large permease n=1 Tax=Paracoccus homiensis TaxID=364199 RepID=UPI00398C88F9